MARALRDAGFKDVAVSMDYMMLDGVHYQVNDLFIQWQQNAIDEEVMSPIAMKFYPEDSLVELVEQQ